MSSYDGVEREERGVLTYLVGELWRRVGDLKQAREWFERVPSEVEDADRQAWILDAARQQQRFGRRIEFQLHRQRLPPANAVGCLIDKLYIHLELPFAHPIFHSHFDFANGLPKIHEHDGKPPQGFGLFHEGRLVVLYSYESDLGDGWEPPSVHDVPPELRRAALQMGTNILVYAMRN